MPRLPTMRVMGSQAISTNEPGSRLTCDGSGMVVVIRTSLSRNALNPKGATRIRSHLPGAGCSGFERCARVPPTRLFVDRATGDVAQAADDRAVEAGCRGGHLPAGWF